mmetsp:Transcript_29711/g.78872  ORF Transcript_29711/g.78872 Transcript_29711/m.78872 type:complete len:306 (+) Transcript_29711:283-1200(+)
MEATGWGATRLRVQAPRTAMCCGKKKPSSCPGTAFTTTAEISSISYSGGQSARDSSTRQSAHSCECAEAAAQTAAAAGGTMSQTPSVEIMRLDPISKGRTGLISGSAKIPTLLASKSPRARDIAKPGPSLPRTKTRRQLVVLTSPPHAMILCSDSASNLCSAVAYASLSPHASVSIESPTCADITVLVLKSTSAHDAVVPDCSHRPSRSSSAWQIANSWPNITGARKGTTSAKPGASRAKISLAWLATQCPNSPCPSNTAARSLSPGRTRVSVESWLIQDGFSCFKPQIVRHPTSAEMRVLASDF